MFVWLIVFISVLLTLVLMWRCNHCGNSTTQGEKITISHKLIESGKEFLRGKRILVTGLARNVAGSLKRNVYLFENIFRDICHVEYYIYENDSYDNSNVYLNELKQELGERFHFTSDVFNHGRSPISFGEHDKQRFQKMFRLRNKCVQWYRSRQLARVDTSRSVYDYVLVFDWDVRYDFNMDAMYAIFGQSDMWDVVSANGISKLNLQKKKYILYDPLAYKSIDGYRVHGHPKWKHGTLTIPSFNPYQLRDLQPVQSNFAGLTIYKSKLFDKYDYTPHHKDDIDCEHIILHDKFPRDTTRFFIYPQLLLSP